MDKLEPRQAPEEQQGGSATHAGKKQKKKRTTLQKIMIALAVTLGALLLIAGGLILRLLSRVSAPGTHTFADEDGTVAAYAAATPAPTPTPAPIPATEAPVENAEPTPTPLPTPEPGPLPLEDIYTQTYLTGEQLQTIAENKADSDVINILLVGVDRRGTRGDSNADVVMVATLDKKNNRLKLTSLLRDLYVPIEGFAPGRLNSAAARGGMPLLIGTVNSVLRLNIQNYVLVDFSMFEKIVNKLGGVTVYMTSKEISAANDNIAGLNKQRGVDYLWDGFIFANAGNVKLTGKQALGYARIRKIDSDFKRTNRQFNVLKAIYAKFRSKNLVEQYALLDELLPLVETDLSGVQIIDLAITALSLDTGGLLHYTVPADGLYKSGRANGSYALLLDMPASAWAAHDFIYASTEEPEEAKVLSPGSSLPPRTPSPTLDPVPEYPGQYPHNPGGPIFVTPTPEPWQPVAPYIPIVE